MKPLPVALLKEVVAYDPETGAMTWKVRPLSHFQTQAMARYWNSRWAGTKAFTAPRADGYRHGSLFAVKYLAHRVVWALHYGESPTDQIDHINGNPSDNRISNLRIANKSENRRNSARPNNNTSGVCGVSNYYDKWQARIKVNRKLIHLGTFLTQAEAIAARKAAEQKYGFHPNHGRAA